MYFVKFLSYQAMTGFKKTLTSEESVSLVQVISVENNLTYYNALSHLAPGGNLQEAKLLYSGAETEGAFGYSCMLECFVLKTKRKRTHRIMWTRNWLTERKAHT